jgi:hypothetical protein
MASRTGLPNRRSLAVVIQPQRAFVVLARPEGFEPPTY